MMNQLRSEWLKLRSVRSTMLMLIFAVCSGVGGATLVAMFSTKRIDVSNVLAGTQVASMIVIVLGVLVIGQEYRFNTIRSTFTATTRRSRVLIAKAVVVGAAVVAAMSVLLAAALGAAMVVATVRDVTFDVWPLGMTRVLVGIVVMALLSAWFGFGIGCVVRQPIAGIPIALAWTLVVEGVLSNAISQSQRWLPFASAANLTSLELRPSLHSPSMAVLYSGACVLVLVVLGMVSIVRSDA